MPANSEVEAVRVQKLGQGHGELTAKGTQIMREQKIQARSEQLGRAPLEEKSS